jgi:hypothetical protein
MTSEQPSSNSGSESSARQPYEKPDMTSQPLYEKNALACTKDTSSISICFFDPSFGFTS